MVDSVGKSEGLAILWGDDICVTIQNFSQGHVNGVVKIPECKVPWKFTCFYGYPDVAMRNEAWALLK